jgi:DNA-binding response OmpR family regulator
VTLIDHDNPRLKTERLEEDVQTLKRRIINQDETKEALSTSDNKTATVLLVDDEQDLLKTSERYLQRRGYQVITAENGTEAIDKYRTDGIDLVILDVGLPDMDGLRCLETIKSINQNAKIVINTGSYANEKKMLDIGAETVLSKPYSLEELYNTAKGILNGQSCSTE